MSTPAPVLPVDQRATEAVGRHARLELRFERRGGRTIVVHQYAEPPLRIGHSFAVGDAAYVILACAGPGVFAGDCFRAEISVGPGARALIASQAALQVHPAAHEAPARVFTAVRVEDG